MLKRFKKSISKALIFSTLFGGINLHSRAILGLHPKDTQLLYKADLLPPNTKENEKENARQEILSTYLLMFSEDLLKFIQDNKETIEFANEENKKRYEDYPNHSCGLYFINEFVNFFSRI